MRCTAGTSTDGRMKRKRLHCAYLSHGRDTYTLLVTGFRIPATCASTLFSHTCRSWMMLTNPDEAETVRKCPELKLVSYVQ
jgi:hypothetical protein